MKDKILLPKELTAENGAKGLLIGEFFQTIETICPDCCDDGDTQDDCDLCGGDGYIEKKVTVPWETIKEIYKMIVENMGCEP